MHLNALVKVGGVVTRRTAIYPQLKMVMFDCTKCGYRVGPYYQVCNPLRFLHTRTLLPGM